MTISELKSKKSELVLACRTIMNQAKGEKREMTQEEQQMFDNNLAEIDTLKSQIDKLTGELLDVASNRADEPEEEKPAETEEPKEEEPKEDEIKKEDSIEDETKEEEETPEEQPQEEDTEEVPVENQEEETENEDSEKEEINNKIKRNHINMNTSITKEIRSALENGTNKFNLSAETRAVQVTGTNGVHDHIVEEKIDSILTPLYADSLYQKFNLYVGNPMGDLRVPILSKSQAAWATETGTATTVNNTFSSVLLQPHRLTRVLVYSRQFLVQDTLDAESKLREDIYKALINSLNETMFGKSAGTSTRPAGLFYNVTEHGISDYASLCAAEALVDDSNAKGELQYICSNKAKSVLRQMIKGTNATGMVYERGEVDGTPCTATSLVPDNYYMYGDLSNVIVAHFGDIIITLDPYTLAADSCVRVIIDSWWDWKKVREDENVIVFGEVTAPSTIDSSI